VSFGPYVEGTLWLRRVHLCVDAADPLDNGDHHAACVFPGGELGGAGLDILRCDINPGSYISHDMDKVMKELG
jgi:hypothetical protein